VEGNGASDQKRCRIRLSYARCSAPLRLLLDHHPRLQEPPYMQVTSDCQSIKAVGQCKLTPRGTSRLARVCLPSFTLGIPSQSSTMVTATTASARRKRKSMSRPHQVLENASSKRLTLSRCQRKFSRFAKAPPQSIVTIEIAPATIAMMVQAHHRLPQLLLSAFAKHPAPDQYRLYHLRPALWLRMP
jgi:hypothetical protein